MLDAGSSKNGIGYSRRSTSSKLMSVRAAAMPLIHVAAFSPKRVARVVLMMIAILGLAIGLGSDRFADLGLARRVEELLLPRKAGADVAHVLDEHLAEPGDASRARPVALQLGGEHRPSQRNTARLNHALDGHLVGLEAHAAGGVGHEVDLVAIAERMDDRKGEADFGPQRRHDDLLPAGLLYPLDDALVFPGVDERAID